jgi:hypothetical protein
MWYGIVNRSFDAEEFDAYVSSLRLEDYRWKPEFIVLHNTFIPRFTESHPGIDHWSSGEVTVEQRLMNMEKYYRDQLRLNGGPHLFIADRIWVFTPLTCPGSHTMTGNDISYGVEMVGDYNVEPLSDIVRDNTISALISLTRHSKLDPKSLRLHKDDPKAGQGVGYGDSRCPGVNVDKQYFIDQIVNATKQQEQEQEQEEKPKVAVTPSRVTLKK